MLAVFGLVFLVAGVIGVTNFRTPLAEVHDRADRT
jgi:hypothetical protein